MGGGWGWFVMGGILRFAQNDKGDGVGGGGRGWEDGERASSTFLT
jgi:hypothetical protein